MNFNNTVLTLGLVAALLQMPATSFAQGSGANRSNPLLQKSSLPFGPPDFSKIQETDYLPAIQAAIKNQRENIQKIVDNKKKPTFQNTILAYEESGVMLDRVINVFTGRTINGKKFDSSRGGAPLAVRLCDLIEGWIVAMQQMCVGDKWEVYIPAEMGYGKFSQPGIPGGSTLIFEIELLGIA